MKKTALSPTTDNIRNTFINDKIGRNKSIVDFIKLIDSLAGSLSIALDSYWGSGKTFFVKQVKMVMDSLCEKAYDLVEGKDQVIDRWNSIAQGKEIKKYVSVYYDAWLNDNDEDPLLSLIFQMVNDTKKNKGLKDKINISDIISVAGKIAGSLKGIDPSEIASSLKKTNYLEKIEQRVEIENHINKYISKLLPDGCDRLLIFVDELDRCNPQFAIRLLERIKHFINNEKVIFVFSVNLFELQHTIKSYYGSDFNASKYLDRFFDLRVSLPPIDLTIYQINNSLNTNRTIDYTIFQVIKMYNMQLREMNKYIDTVKFATEYKEQTPTNIKNVILNIILPFIIGLHMTDVSKYNSFISGNDSSELCAFLRYSDTLNKLFNIAALFLFDSERYDKSAEDFLSDPATLESRIGFLYFALFERGKEFKAGMCTIHNSDRDFFWNRLSLLDS